LHAMLVTKLKVAAVLLLAVGAVSMGVNALALQALPQLREQRQATPSPLGVPRPKAETQAKAPLAVPAQETPEQTTVVGRVLDPDGKAVAEAPVAVVGWDRPPGRQSRVGSWQVYVQGKTDREGRFRLTTPRTSKDWNHVLASAVG